MKITNQISAKRRSKSRRAKTSSSRKSPVKKSSKKKNPNAGKIAGSVLGGFFGGAALAFGGSKLIAKVKKDQDNNPASGQTSGTGKKCNKSFKVGSQSASAVEKQQIEDRHKNDLAAQSVINIAENNDHFSAKIYKDGQSYLGYKPTDGDESFYQITEGNVKGLLKSIDFDTPTLEGVKQLNVLTADQEQKISTFLSSGKVKAFDPKSNAETPELIVDLEFDK